MKNSSLTPIENKNKIKMTAPNEETTPVIRCNMDNTDVICHL